MYFRVGDRITINHKKYDFTDNWREFYNKFSFEIKEVKKEIHEDVAICTLTEEHKKNLKLKNMRIKENGNFSFRSSDILKIYSKFETFYDENI